MRSKNSLKDFISRVIAVGTISVVFSFSFAQGSEISPTEYGSNTEDIVSSHEVTLSDGSKVKVSVPSAADRASIRVYGIEENAEVYAYHLIEANYNKNGFIGWTQTKASRKISKLSSFSSTDENVSQVVAIVTDPDYSQNGQSIPNPDYNKGLIITEKNISDISKAIVKNRNLLEKIKLDFDSETKCYKSDEAEAGTYLVLVESEDKGIIYNPMIVSNDYTSAVDSQSLSNVTDTKTGLKGTNQNYMHHELYEHFQSERGVLIDSNNSYTEYLYQLDEKHSNLYEEGFYNPLTFFRDVEKEGNLYALVDNDKTKVKTMALKGRAYAKRSEIPLEKYIVHSSVKENPAEDNSEKLNYCKYDDVSEGDEVCFDIHFIIPDYSATYFDSDDDFVFKITDEQCLGLDPVKEENLEIWIGYTDQNEAEKIAYDLIDSKTGKKMAPGLRYHFTAEDNGNSGNTFTINFDKQFITNAEHAGKNVVIRYKTRVNEKAALGLAGNPNSVYLKYTSVPGESAEKSDFVLQYTFTELAVKIDESGEIKNTNSELNCNVGEEFEVLEDNLQKTYPLSGAKFRLERIKDRYGNNLRGKNAVHIWYLTSDDEGIIRFDTEKNGIDEGTYVLTEYEAPKGYALNDKEYIIEIKAEYDEVNKKLVSYSFGSGERMTIIDYDSDNDNVTILPDILAVPNTHLTRLPSTGSSGRLILIISGLVIVFVSAVIFIKTGKRNDKKK